MKEELILHQSGAKLMELYFVGNGMHEQCKYCKNMARIYMHITLLCS